MATFTTTPASVKTSDTHHGLRAPKGGCVVDGKFYRGGCFCRPYNPDNVHELPTVVIKGADYLVEAIPAGECGVSAVRLTKLAGRESYDVIRRHDGLVECDCPSYTFTHEGKGTACKHGVACMAHGLLPLAEVAPVAPVVEVEVEVEAEDEPARVPDGPVDLGSPWVDHFARLYSDVVLECVDRARDKTRRDSPLAPWGALLEGERSNFVRWLDRVGFEVEMDCDWTRFDRFLTACLEGLPVSFPDPDGPAPTWDPERFEPTPEEEAESLEEDPEYHAWLDRLAEERMADAFAEVGRDWHDDEMIRAVGCIAARSA